MHRQTGQIHYASGHNTLGGGIKIINYNCRLVLQPVTIQLSDVAGSGCEVLLQYCHKFPFDGHDVTRSTSGIIIRLNKHLK